MTRVWIGLALGCGVVAACGGTPPFGSQEGAADEGAGSVFLTESNADLTLNNIAYDPVTDTLTLNNIPFDDPENAYQRLTTEAFTNGFDAYESNPAPGSNELQYFAVFRRSDSGASQVAASSSAAYISFGFAGAGAQRLSGGTGLPRNGIYSYTGEYAAVRTLLNVDVDMDGNADENDIQFVTGTAQVAADFGDFDDVGAVNAIIDNRQLYDRDGALVGNLAGFLTLANGDIDFTNGTIEASTASEEVGGSIVRSGNWQGVFAGPGGVEVAGALFVEGDEIREVGGFVATCTSAACP